MSAIRPRPGDARLEDLFVRYWDDTLSPAEAAELAARLRADPIARDQFRLLCLQAVAAAERPAVARTAAPARKAWSRRQWLQYSGAGVAAGVAAAVVGGRIGGRSESALRVTAVRGVVRLSDPDPQPVTVGAAVPPGGSISTHGFGSSVVLAYPDGSSVVLTGDSSAAVREGGRLALRDGCAAVDARPQPAGDPPFTLETAEATLTARAGAGMIVGRGARATEVGVHDGQVTVSDPAGTRLADVRGGELYTVRADGDRRRQPLTDTPDAFAWDLARPLPEGWHVGVREVTADGPAVRPEFWPDPYYQGTRMAQIRSDKQWTRGFFRLHPDSVVRVRYRVDAPGPSQLTVCVRTADPSRSDTGVMEVNGAFAAARPGAWQWLEVKAGDMLDNKHTPGFGPPWVGFLVIFNTYTIDLGLRVSEFRVARPGEPPPRP